MWHTHGSTWPRSDTQCLVHVAIYEVDFLGCGAACSAAQRRRAVRPRGMQVLLSTFTGRRQCFRRRRRRDGGGRPLLTHATVYAGNEEQKKHDFVTSKNYCCGGTVFCGWSSCEKLHTSLTLKLNLSENKYVPHVCTPETRLTIRLAQGMSYKRKNMVKIHGTWSCKRKNMVKMHGTWSYKRKNMVNIHGTWSETHM